MRFRLDDYGFFWVARGRFASWAGYLDRSGPYGGAGGAAPSDGSVEIVFAPEGRDASPLTPAELGLVQWLIDNEPAVSAAVKAAILREYPRLQEAFGDRAVPARPPPASAEQLKALVGLYAINVHQLDTDGRPYVGFEFGCAWDEEHGVGVLTHGTEVVAVGGSDTARLLWLARQHAGHE